jgi:peptidyl-prolyl cis-trans isomerase SurA
MKHIKNGLLTALLLASSFSFGQALDRIIAVVNEDVVTELELKTRIELIKTQYAANPSVLPNDQVLTKQILDTLILESLQIQMAERGNLVIPDQKVDTALSNIAKNQNLTLSQFLNALENSGRNVSDFRNQVKKELTISEVQKQVLGRQIFISESEIDRFLSSQSGQLLNETEYQLSYLRLENKTEADDLVESVSEANPLIGYENSRDLGLRALKDIPSIFQTLVPVLELNEAVALERDGIYHVAQLTSKTETKSINVEEYRIRHILIKPDELFDATSAKSLLSDLKSQIENGASMSDLANTYSQDAGTRGRGGDLDWNNLDTFVPTFGQAARVTPQGELSDIIESPFGFHILRVEEVRTRDVGLDVIRSQVKNQLYQRRYSESLQRWLTELRAESFVELRN